MRCRHKTSANQTADILNHKKMLKLFQRISRIYRIIEPRHDQGQCILTLRNIRLLCSQTNSSIECNDIQLPSHSQTESVKTAKYSPLDDPVLSAFDEDTKVSLHSHLEEIKHPGLTTLTDLVKYSTDLQMLVALGVSLKDVEKHEEALDLLSNIKYYPTVHNILKLLGEVGVTEFGSIITKYPFFLTLEPKTLIDRILYLSRRQFSREQIALIITKYPRWLCEEIDEVDARLGAFQKLFDLKGHEVRTMACKSPRVIHSNMVDIQKARFLLKEIQEFSPQSQKSIVVNCPSVLLISETKLTKRINYLMDTMGISEKVIASWPMVLECRQKILDERHTLLSNLDMAEYNPTQPGFITLQRLVSGTTDVFCSNVAKISKEQYYEFLKTL